MAWNTHRVLAMAFRSHGLVLVALVSGCNGSKAESRAKLAEHTTRIYSTAERLPNGDAKVRVFADPGNEAFEVTVLGHKAKLSGRQNPEVILTIPRAELTPGRHDYKFTGEYTDEYAHVVGEGQFTFNAFTDLPPIEWLQDPKADLTARVALPEVYDESKQPRISGSLDDKGNLVFAARAAQGTKLTVDGVAVPFTGGRAEIAIPVLAKAAGMKPKHEESVRFSTKLAFDGGAEVLLVILPYQVADMILRAPQRGVPVLFPGETATDKRATMWIPSFIGDESIGSISTLSDIDLIGSISSQTKKLGACTYTGNFVVEREEETVTATVVERRTGKKLASKTFRRAGGRGCPSEISVKASQRGSAWRYTPSNDEIKAWFRTQVS